MAAANGCCLSRERRNVSAVPTAPCIVFQLLSLRLAYHGFNKQCAQLDTERPTSAQVWGKHFSPHHQPYLCFLWVFLDLSPLASPLTTVRFLSLSILGQGCDSCSSQLCVGRIGLCLGFLWVVWLHEAFFSGGPSLLKSLVPSSQGPLASPEWLLLPGQGKVRLEGGHPPPPVPDVPEPWSFLLGHIRD